MPATTFSEWVLYFTLFSVLGWLCETVWCSIARKRLVNCGFLGGPWCPIYGFGGVVVLMAGGALRQYPLAVLAISLLVSALLEYFTGWLLEALFKMRWWDYSGRRLNLRGRICLRNTVIFGLAGLAGLYLLQPLGAWLFTFVLPTSQRVLASLLVAALFIDLFFSLAAAAKLDERLRKLQAGFAQMAKQQPAYHWYDAKDLSGSLAKLREVCAAQPDNPVAAEILVGIDAQLNGKNGALRLGLAFPNAQSREHAAELAVLRSEWAADDRERERLAHLSREAVKVKRAERRAALKLSYKDINASQLVWVFLIGCVIGYVVETLFCLLTLGVLESRQGMLYGPFNQVYGIGAVLMVLALTPFAHKGAGWLFVGSAVVGGLFEALCSWLQETFFGSTSWEYSEEKFSFFNGRTSLTYMIFWGILGVVYMKYIYPRMVTLINRVPKRPRRFFTWVIVVVLAADLALSALAVGRWSQRVEGIPASGSVGQWLDQHYPDEFMEKVYPNMEFTSTSSSVAAAAGTAPSSSGSS